MNEISAMVRYLAFMSILMGAIIVAYGLGFAINSYEELGYLIIAISGVIMLVSVFIIDPFEENE